MRLESRVQVLEEKKDGLTKRYVGRNRVRKREGRHLRKTNVGDIGDGWWLRVPTVRCVWVNVWCRRKISRVVRQLLEQEETKNSGGRWSICLR